MPLERVYNNTSENMAFLFFEGSSKSDTTRARITIWDVLADLGGMLEIVMISFPFLVTFY